MELALYIFVVGEMCGNIYALATSFRVKSYSLYCKSHWEGPTLFTDMLLMG